MDDRGKKGFRSTRPVASDIVADRPIRDAIAIAVLFSDLLPFLQGQTIIGERFDELDDPALFSKRASLTVCQSVSC